MSQTTRLLKELKKRPLTKAQIWGQLGILNGGGRIYELRQYHDIETIMVNRKRKGGKVAQYHYRGEL